jgi:lysophospholipase L1-like esterase
MTLRATRAGLALLLAVTGFLAPPASPAPAGPAAAGPTPAPTKDKDWPGKGNVWVPGGWNARRDLFWKSREKEQSAVVFFGDSIMEGWGSLAQDFPSLKPANRGISGDTSRGLLFRLKEDVLDLHPKAVVILIGTNDLGGGSSPKDVAANIQSIVLAIQKQKAGTPVILCRVMPRGAEAGKFPEKIKELNALIDPMVAGARTVAVCDTWGVFATPDGTCKKEEFPDMLHPNGAGYAKWVEALKPIMAKLKIE